MDSSTSSGQRRASGEEGESPRSQAGRCPSAEEESVLSATRRGDGNATQVVQQQVESGAVAQPHSHQAFDFQEISGGTMQLGTENHMQSTHNVKSQKNVQHHTIKCETFNVTNVYNNLPSPARSVRAERVNNEHIDQSSNPEINVQQPGNASEVSESCGAEAQGITIPDPQSPELQNVVRILDTEGKVILCSHPGPSAETFTSDLYQVERKIDSLKGCYNQQKRAYAKTGSEGGRKGKGWIHYQRMASFLGRLDYAASQTSVITPQSYVLDSTESSQSMTLFPESSSTVFSNTIHSQTSATPCHLNRTLFPESSSTVFSSTIHSQTSATPCHQSSTIPCPQSTPSTLSLPVIQPPSKKKQPYKSLGQKKSIQGDRLEEVAIQLADSLSKPRSEHRAFAECMEEMLGKIKSEKTIFRVKKDMYDILHSAIMNEKQNDPES